MFPSQPRHAPHAPNSNPSPTARAWGFMCALVVATLAFSQTAHAEDPWTVTLGAVESGGCSQGFYHNASEIQVSLDLTDPLAPTLTLEGLKMHESGSLLEDERVHNGPTWSRHTATLKGTLTASDLDQKTWTFALQSTQKWALKSPPSPLDPPRAAPDTTNTLTDTDPDLTLSCRHQKLPLSGGPEIIALKCDMIAKSGLDGAGLEGFRVYDEGPDYKQRFYLRQDGPLTGLYTERQNEIAWQETSVSKSVWGE